MSCVLVINYDNPMIRELKVEGEHDEACIAMLNNFYADGAVSAIITSYIQWA